MAAPAGRDATLANFQELTGSNNIAECERILDAANWDLNDALNRFFSSGDAGAAAAGGAGAAGAGAGGMAGAGLAGAGAGGAGGLGPGASGASLAAADHQVDSGHGIGIPVQDDDERDTRAALRPGIVRGWLRWILSGTWWLLMAPFTFVIGPILGYGQRDNTPPDGFESRRFASEFERQYGKPLPAVHQGTFGQAMAQARNLSQFLVVYVHSPYHHNTEDFCRNVLATEQVVSLINDNFVFWAGSITTAEGYALNNRLRVASYPSVTVHQSDGRLVDRLEGAMTADFFVNRLSRTLQVHGAALLAERSQREEREMARRIREEQDLAYQESLRADQAREQERREAAERERREQEEAIERERRLQEEAEREERLQRQKETERTERVQRLRQRLPAEPETGTTAPVTNIMVRLPDGRRIGRKFLLQTHSIQDVYDFVAVNDPGMDDFLLLSNYPRCEYRPGPQTLQDAGISAQAALFLQEL